MIRIGDFLSWLRRLALRHPSQQGLEREIRFHIEMETRDRMAAGSSEEEARREALAAFGSMPQCHENVRYASRSRAWTDLQKDFLYALRAIRRRPAFAALTVLTLAIGIGANTAVFSVFDRAILRPLPYDEPDPLVHLWETRASPQFGQMEASFPNFTDWKERNRGLQEIAGYDGTNFTITGFGAPRRISAVRVTTNMLSLLHVQPQLGRDFTREEEALANSHVAIATYAFWQRYFGAQPEAIGQTVRLGGVPHTIVGILPRDFRFPLDAGMELMVPLGPTTDQLGRRSFHWLRAIARLKPHVALAAAEFDLKRVAQELELEHAETNTGTSVRLIPLHDQVVGNIGPVLKIVFSAAACMFCLALLNLANLFIAQFAVREREMAIRTALGAGVPRLARQLLTECLVVASLGGLLSIAVAHWTLRILPAIAPDTLMATIASVGGNNIDSRVLAFNAALAIVGALFIGAMPVLRLSRSSINNAIKPTSHSATQQRLRTVLTVAEIALAVTLLVCSAVMIQSVRRLTQVNPGFKAAQLVSMQVSLPEGQYPQDQDVASFYRELQHRVSEIPGVERAAIIDELPLTKDGGTVHVAVYGQPVRPGEELETVVRSASTSYFETMGIPLKRGRTFDDRDALASKHIVLLNETLATLLFGKVDPVGRRLTMTFNKTDWEIAGVVGDVHLADLDRAVRPTLYTFAPQDPSRSSTLVFRTATDVDRLAAAVSTELQRMDPSLPIYAARSIEDTIRLTPGVATRRLVLYLIGAFSVIGTLMAGIGLFGLMSFVVAQRSKEIGIRMALGAAPGTLRRLVLTQAMTMTGLGLAAGIVIAVASSRFIQGVIFGVTPSTPSVLAIVCVLVGAITFVACYTPIRRATRVDPVVVLRND